MNSTSTLARLFAALLHRWTLIVVTALGIGFAVNAENAWDTLPFALAVPAILFGLLLAASGRPAFSLYGAWAVVGLVAVISAIKFKMHGYAFHYYDLVTVVTDLETSRFLLSSYPYLILPVAALLAGAVAFGSLVFKRDRKVRGMAARLAPLAIGAALVGATLPRESDATRVFYYISARHISAFFVSLLDLQHLWVENALEARLEQMPAESPLADQVSCPQARPDVFVILGETHTDPAFFPQIAGADRILPTYSPGVGETRPMYVEAFGGGTWVTNLSLFTGLSAADFGWRSHYLTTALEGRVKGAMPEVFARCGYRTAVLMPMADTFVNEGPFLRSIGFETILDMDDIEAPSYHMRDAFYYAAAEAFIERHRREDGRPLFLEIQTMFPHSPYDEPTAGRLLANAPFDASGETGEYLARLALARSDMQAFYDRRRAEAAVQPSVLLEFGDHQPFVTRPLVEALDGPDALSRPRSLAYKTVFSAVGFGHVFRSEIPGDIDIAYLGASFVEAAGLPSSPLLAELVRLRDHCRGAFFTCSDRAAVDRHLRRRIDSGMLDLFHQADPLASVAFRREPS